MRPSYYDPGEQRALRVRELFSRIAPRYDLLNDLQSFWLHRLWKGRLLSFARPRPGETALDVCCGTGDLALALARRGADVVGVDFTKEMLEVARHRGFLNSVQGDALELPFGKQTFDIVTMAYGLRNLRDWQEGIRELCRVAKPNGRILILEFAKPANALLRIPYFAYLRLAVPGFGRIFCGDANAYAYILESLRAYPSPAIVASEIENSGCKPVQVFPLLGGIMSIHFAVRLA